MSSHLTQALLSYTPNYCLSIVQRVYAQQQARLAPQWQRLQASILFVDVSGYSTLARKLAQQASSKGHGEEKLAASLNQYLTRLIAVAVEHRGDIVKFAGDALIILWWHPIDNTSINNTPIDSNKNILNVLVDSAMQCAFEIQSHLRNFRTQVSDFTFNCKAEVAAGEILALLVGGHAERFEFLLVGDVFRQLKQTETVALPGRVVASAQALAHIERGKYRIEKQYDDDHDRVALFAHHNIDLNHTSKDRDNHLQQRHDCVADADRLLRAFVPLAVQKRLADMLSSQASTSSLSSLLWLPDLRNVVVIFTVLPDLQSVSVSDGEAALLTVQRAFSLIQEVVQSSDGEVRALLDDKGFVCISVWGLQNHEDDAVRAVRAALSIRDRLLPMSSFSGVTSGTAFCGPVGDASTRSEYAMVGDVINLAARLMSTGEKSRRPILIDAATQALASQVFSFTSQQPIRVKGRNEPVEIFAPTSASTTEPGTTAPTSGRRPLYAQKQGQRIYGRDGEVQRLQQAMNSAGNGDAKKKGIIICGSAGAGKTHLCASALQGAEKPLVVCAGFAMDMSTPFGAVRPLVASLLALPSMASFTEYLTKCARTGTVPLEAPHVELFDAELRDCLSLLSLVHDFDPVQLKHCDRIAAWSEADRLTRTRDVVVELVRVCASLQALIVFAEDVHWFDVMSWRILYDLLSLVPNVFVVANSRPPAESGIVFCAEAESFYESTHNTIMPLAPLSSPVIERIVLTTTGVQPVLQAIDEPCLAVLYDRCKGNPFIAKELFLYVVANKSVVISSNGTQWQFPEGVTALQALPDRVQVAIVSRVDRLATADQVVLKAASVIGMDFTVSTLVQVLQSDEQAVRDSLVRLQAQRFIESSASTSSSVSSPMVVNAESFSFHHVLIQESVYSTLLHESRRQLHAACARLFVTKHQHTTPSVGDISLTAFHYRLAGDTERAIEYQLKAATINFQLMVLRDGVQCLKNLFEMRTYRQCTRYSDEWWRYVYLHGDYIAALAMQYRSQEAWAALQQLAAEFGWPLVIAERQPWSLAWTGASLSTKLVPTRLFLWYLHSWRGRSQRDWQKEGNLMAPMLLVSLFFGAQRSKALYATYMRLVSAWPRYYARGGSAFVRNYSNMCDAYVCSVVAHAYPHAIPLMSRFQAWNEIDYARWLVKRYPPPMQLEDDISFESLYRMPGSMGAASVYLWNVFRYDLFFEMLDRYLAQNEALPPSKQISTGMIWWPRMVTMFSLHGGLTFDDMRSNCLQVRRLLPDINGSSVQLSLVMTAMYAQYLLSASSGATFRQVPGVDVDDIATHDKRTKLLNEFGRIKLVIWSVADLISGVDYSTDAVEQRLKELVLALTGPVYVGRDNIPSLFFLYEYLDVLLEQHHQQQRRLTPQLRRSVVELIATLLPKFQTIPAVLSDNVQVALFRAMAALYDDHNHGSATCRALHHFQEAHQLATTIGLRFEAARALEGMARCQHDSAQRRALLEQAAKAFEEMAAHRLAERCRARTSSTERDARSARCANAPRCRHVRNTSTIKRIAAVGVSVIAAAAALFFWKHKSRPSRT